MRVLRNFLIGLILVIVGIVLLMLLPSPQPDSFKPWEVTIMPDDNVEVLGIHLGTTDYKTAQQQLNMFGTTALFNEPNGDKSVEAFFDSTNLGGLSAKLVLNIAVPEPTLNQMLERAGAGKLQPSGAHKYALSEADKQELLTMPVMAITYIPTVRLSQDMIVSRFGDPSDKFPTQANDDGQTGEVWHYEEIHLDVVFEPEQKPILLFRAKTARTDAVTDQNAPYPPAH